MARSTQPKSNVVPMPDPKRKRPLGMWRILHAAARMLPRRGVSGGNVVAYRPNPFTPAQPLPGVVGGEGKPKIPKIAMDAAEAFKGALDDGGVAPSVGWIGSGANHYFASAYAEGQEWLGYAVLAILSQRPEYRVMTDTYATEMTREWIKFKSKSEDHDKQPKIDELNTRLTGLRLKQVVKSAIEHDGFQGRGQIYIDTGDEDDPEELRTPIGSGGKDSQAKFGKDGLAHDFVPSNLRESDSDQPERKRKKIKRLAAIEPMWCYPSQYNADDPLKPDWYRPDVWWVMGKEVHRTRLLTFISNPVPNMLMPAYSFGGLSRTQMAKPYVDFWLRNRTSASDLLNNFSIVTLATELDVTTMDEGSELFQRVQTANVCRDNQGMMLINKESEELSINQASLAGVKDLVGQSAEHMTVPNQIPIVKFFGNQPSGLNADSEGVIRLWYDRVHSLQESLIREPIQTIVNLVQIELWGKVDDDIEFEFVELWQLDEAGKSAIQKTKADQRAVDIEAQIILPEEGRLAAARDPDSQYAGLDLHEPLPEPDPAELLDPEGGGGQPAGGGREQGGAKPQRRDLGSMTRSSANFGGATTGGFSKDSEDREDDGRPFDQLEEEAWDEWVETQHPRGQPENKGQFASAGAGGGGNVSPPPQIKSQHAANVGKQKHLNALHALANAGKWNKIAEYPTPGTNTYAKIVQKYKAALLAAHAPVGKQPEEEKKAIVTLPVGAKYQKSEHTYWNGVSAIRNYNEDENGNAVESLVIGTGSGNAGKWQIYQKGKGVIAAGEGQESLNEAHAKLYGEKEQAPQEPSPQDLAHEKLVASGYEPTSVKGIYQKGAAMLMYDQSDHSWTSDAPGKPVVKGQGYENLSKFLDLVKEGKQVYNVNFGATSQTHPTPAPAASKPVPPPVKHPPGYALPTDNPNMKYLNAAAPPASFMQRNAVSDYTDGKYTQWNKELRQGLVPDPDSGMAHLTDWLEKASFPEDRVVVRRVSSDYAHWIKSLPLGSEFVDHGFMSTSTGTQAWSGHATMEIRVPKGSRAAAVQHISSHKTENEVIIQRGSRLRVVDVGSDGHLVCELSQPYLHKIGGEQ